MLENGPASVAMPSHVQPPTVEPPRRQRGPSQHRSKTTNDPLVGRTDRNTARGRRIADLYRAFVVAMGFPANVIAQANALAAAELKVAAEDARKQLLAGELVDPDQIVRLENLAHRAERKLGIKPGKTAAPSLAEHLRAAELAAGQEPAA